MSNFGGTETRLIGRVAVGSNDAVLGRIKFFDESYTEGSILCVREGEQVDRSMLLLCPPIAIVVFCCEGAASLGELCSLGVPCIVLEQGDVLYERCKNKVALIDTERGILTLDPSLDTLNFYSSSRARSEQSGFDCPFGRILRDTVSIGRHEGGVEHFLVSGDLLGESGEIFESAVSLWERLCPETLTVDVRVPSGNERDERDFSERIEELFRAALYGSFSISFSGFDCEGELCQALKLLHKAFCVLEAEGREFNGYIPRGITLSSPLWLMRQSPVTNPDFIIFDLDRLLPSLFSLTPDEIIKKEKALQKELFLVLERYFVHFAPRCDVLLKSERFIDTRLLRGLISLADVKAVFC